MNIITLKLRNPSNFSKLIKNLIELTKNESLQIGLTIVLGFLLKLASIFLDLVCSVYVVTIPTGTYYSFIISFKCDFHISCMFSTCSNHYKGG